MHSQSRSLTLLQFFAQIAHDAFNITQRQSSVKIFTTVKGGSRGIIAFLLIDFLGARESTKYFESWIPERMGEASFRGS